ncbi:MAG TPA: DUF2332 domain-containing protein [Solirubrobacteraceae bacterium]|nr:DUF2332 domain-containing protein [Solirubrobacteraceae bacterium]
MGAPAGGSAAEAAAVAGSYSRFAEFEALGRSELYVELARGVAGDPELCALLAALQPAKRQPNLLFGAFRHLCGTPGGYAEFRAGFLDRRTDVVALMLARRTQTNEPARCAVLLPLLARLPQPLALIEVGAAAGLCLLPDRYAYDYGGCLVGESELRFACRANELTPVPGALPRIVWRAGLDLEPLDLHDAGAVAWLESLVWPGEGNRLEQLRAAISIARRDAPRVERGDLRHDLPALAEQAPPGATLVVFHTAVLAYVADAADRAAFARTVRALGARWVANEGAEVLTGGVPVPDEPWPHGRCLLRLDGEPVAWTDPHGTALDWLDSATALALSA